MPAYHRLCPFREACFEIAENPLLLLIRHHWSHLGCGIEARANFDLLRLCSHPLDYFVEDLFLDIEPGAGTTALAMVEEDCVCRAWNPHLQVCILEHKVG